MSDVVWKAVERKLATLLSGQRVPVSGRARGYAPDISHDWLSIEVKSRKTLPSWLLDALAQAVAAQRGDQLPVALLHQCGRPYGDALVMRLRDFRAWFGPDTADEESTR